MTEPLQSTRITSSSGKRITIAPALLYSGSIMKKIRKLGTIDCDLVETTPVVFQGKLHRFEYVRIGYAGNTTGQSYFRFVDHDTGSPSKPFAHGYHLGNVMVHKDTLFVTGTNMWDGERIDVFASSDMEQWETWNALTLPGYGLFNTSMCRGKNGFVLMFEVGKPHDVAGVRFTARFAVSEDLRNWELTPPECTYAKDRYTAPHCLRYSEGYYYNFYLEALPGSYEQYVVRSPDLICWESSPYNPVLKASDDDRRILNAGLAQSQRNRISKAENYNNSDIDFCEFQGAVIINYSWGNQHGIEHLAEAIYDGSEREFLAGWFSDAP